MFELVYLSSKNTCQDVIMGWGAFPIVNGEFEINTGKYKLPMLLGHPDFSTNKFKDIEQKYMRNIDEWLCNLYIDIKKIELFDFRYHEEKIEFTIPKKFLKLLALQKKKQALIDKDIANAKKFGMEREESTQDRTNDDEEDPEDQQSDYSSDDDALRDEGFEGVDDIGKEQRFVDDS